MPFPQTKVAVLFALLAFISWTLFRFERSAEFRSTRLAVKADGDNRQLCSQNIKPSLDNIEDYDWSYCTSDLAPFWASLNITENQFTNSSSIFEATSTFGDLDRDGKDERILRLTLGTSMIRFVILKQVSRGRNAWRTLAHLDIPEFHLAPEARVVSNGRASWLALNNDQRAWGTGILQENETWYELTNGQLVKVLSLPEEVDEVWVAQPTIHRQLKAELSARQFDGIKDRIDVAFNAVFSWGDYDKPTVTVARKVSFAKDPASQVFRFDDANSDITEPTYRAICDLENSDLEYDVLVDFAHDEFVKLASGTDEQRQRVREMLPELTRSKHEPELIRLLSQHKSK
jgi:hypothetical protein